MAASTKASIFEIHNNTWNSGHDIHQTGMYRSMKSQHFNSKLTNLNLGLPTFYLRVGF